MQRPSACATSIRAAKANTEGRILFGHNTPKGLAARTNRLPPRVDVDVVMDENRSSGTPKAPDISIGAVYAQMRHLSIKVHVLIYFPVERLGPLLEFGGVASPSRGARR